MPHNSGYAALAFSIVTKMKGHPPFRRLYRAAGLLPLPHHEGREEYCVADVRAYHRLPGRESSVMHPWHIYERMCNEQSERMPAYEHQRVKEVLSRVFHSSYRETAQVVEHDYAAICVQRPKQVIPRKQHIPVVAHHRRPEHEERDVARRAKGEQAAIVLKTPVLVAHHEKRKPHGDVRQIERQVIARQVNAETYAYAHNRAHLGRHFPLYEVTRGNAHHHERKQEPRGHVDGYVTVNRKYVERFHHARMPRERAVDKLHYEVNGVSHRCPLKEREEEFAHVLLHAFAAVHYLKEMPGLVKEPRH